MSKIFPAVSWQLAKITSKLTEQLIAKSALVYNSFFYFDMLIKIKSSSIRKERLVKTNITDISMFGMEARWCSE